MLRAALCALLVLAACHRDTDPPPMHPKEGELPPLPPASGTPIGYLVDNASQLNLRDEQITKLKEIDQSLSARNDEIDTQLRLIEKPEQDPQPGNGAPPPRHNNAPGAQVKTTEDATKLHDAHKANDREALKKAFALLDQAQQTAARRLLEERGVAAPGSEIKRPTRDPEDGVPLEPAASRQP
jgi:hypothetical protein